MLQSKILIIIELLRRGYSIFHCDVDVVFLSPYVFRHVNVEDGDGTLKTDLIYQIDHLSKIKGEMINAGLFFARPTNITIELFRQTFALQMSDITATLLLIRRQ